MQSVEQYINRFDGTVVSALMFRYCTVGTVQMNAFTHGKASNFSCQRYTNAVPQFDLRLNSVGTQRVYAGDWVIKFESGSVMVLTGEIFTNTYKQIV